MVGTKLNGLVRFGSGWHTTQHRISIHRKGAKMLHDTLHRPWCGLLLLPVSLQRERKTLLLMTSDYGSVRVISYRKVRRELKTVSLWWFVGQLSLLMDVSANSQNGSSLWWTTFRVTLFRNVGGIFMGLLELFDSSVLCFGIINT